MEKELIRRRNFEISLMRKVDEMREIISKEIYNES